MCSALMTRSELDAGQGSSLQAGPEVDVQRVRHPEKMKPPAAVMEKVSAPRRQHNLVEGGDNAAQSESISCTDKKRKTKVMTNKDNNVY